MLATGWFLVYEICLNSRHLPGKGFHHSHAVVSESDWWHSSFVPDGKLSVRFHQTMCQDHHQHADFFSLCLWHFGFFSCQELAVLPLFDGAVWSSLTSSGTQLWPKYLIPLAWTLIGSHVAMWPATRQSSSSLEFLWQLSGKWPFLCFLVITSCKDRTDRAYLCHNMGESIEEWSQDREKQSQEIEGASLSLKHGRTPGF